LEVFFIGKIAAYLEGGRGETREEKEGNRGCGGRKSGDATWRSSGKNIRKRNPFRGGATMKTLDIRMEGSRLDVGLVMEALTKNHEGSTW